MQISNFDNVQSEQDPVKLVFEKSLKDEIEKPAEHIDIERIKQILDELNDKPLTEWEKEALDGIGRFLKDMIFEKRRNEDA